MQTKTKIEIVKGDITKVSVDAIVNAAKSSLKGGGGVDGAIHRAGGAAILTECEAIAAQQGGCHIGEAVITTAGNLPARFVIHTVGPIWRGGQSGEAEKLANCYKNSLQLAMDNNCRSIAFPSISTGGYRYPMREANSVALDALFDFIAAHPGELETVFLVCMSDLSFITLRSQLTIKQEKECQPNVTIVVTEPESLFDDCMTF